MRWPSVRPLGDVGWSGRGDRQQDRIADRVYDVVRRLRLRLRSTATCTRARSASSRSRSASRTPSSAGSVGRPVARPDRRGRGGFSYPVLDRLLFGGSTSGAPIERWRRSGSTRRWSTGGPLIAGSEFKRQVPPIAKLGHGRRRGLSLPASGDRGRRGGDRRAPCPPARAGSCTRRPPDREPRRRELRALEVLREVPLIAAEDTRIRAGSSTATGFATRATSYHARADAGRAAALLEHLRGGEDLALVTDAGTPPSATRGELVRRGPPRRSVVPIPGASAVLAAVAASGVAAALGFRGLPAALPGRERARRLAARHR